MSFQQHCTTDSCLVTVWYTPKQVISFKITSPRKGRQVHSHNLRNKQKNQGQKIEVYIFFYIYSIHVQNRKHIYLGHMLRWVDLNCSVALHLQSYSTSWFHRWSKRRFLSSGRVILDNAIWHSADSRQAASKDFLSPWKACLKASLAAP